MLLLVAAACGCAAEEKPGGAPQQQDGGLPPLIPLKLLLGNSKYRNAQLSPDGKYIAYVAPSDRGVYNVFIKQLPPPGNSSSGGGGGEAPALFDAEGTASDRQVTRDEGRGVTAYSWAEDGSAILYIQDTNGDENDHLFMVPLAGWLPGVAGVARAPQGAAPGGAAPAPVDLTPFKGVKAGGIVSSKRFPGKMYIGLNRRDPEVFDLYSVDLATGRLTLEVVNPGGLTSWLVDYDFGVKGGMGYNNTDGSSYVVVRDDSKQKGQQQQGATAQEKGGGGGGDLESLFAAAAKGNWSTAQWMAASATRSNASQWWRLMEWPYGEEGGAFKLNKEGDGLWVVSSTGRDTTEFQLVGLQPGAPVRRVVASDPLVNVGATMFDQDSWEPQLVSFNYLKPEWRLLDPSIKADWEALSGFRKGDSVNINDMSTDKQTWVITYSSDNSTARYYLYRKGQWPPRLLFKVQPALEQYRLASMHPVVITARDGLKLPSYLSLPVRPGVPETLPPSVAGTQPDLKAAAAAEATGAAGGGDRSSANSALRTVHRASAAEVAELAAEAKKPGGKRPLDLNLPLILYVHGGPWSRDTWGADAVVQWLANRGYAVLQVNYRGSSGFGKNFLNAGDKQWGVGSMQHDLTDAVKWAVSKGIADPKRVCIFGGSYGGYATLAGLTFTPELYRCGVDLVGISNVGTFQRSIPPYWKPLRYEWLTRVGDAERNATLNQQISPFFHVGTIRAPLLIGQGANDPRVPQAESDQMFGAMKHKGLDVQYVLYPDEGHGLVRPDNRLDFYSRADQFFANHLGGRAEPRATLPGTTAQVVTQVQGAATQQEAGGKPGAGVAPGGDKQQQQQQQQPQQTQQQKPIQQQQQQQQGSGGKSKSRRMLA